MGEDIHALIRQHHVSRKTTTNTQSHLQLLYRFLVQTGKKNNMTLIHINVL